MDECHSGCCETSVRGLFQWVFETKRNEIRNEIFRSFWASKPTKRVKILPKWLKRIEIISKNFDPYANDQNFLELISILFGHWHKDQNFLKLILIHFDQKMTKIDQNFYGVETKFWKILKESSHRNDMEHFDQFRNTLVSIQLHGGLHSTSIEREKSAQVFQ